MSLGRLLHKGLGVALDAPTLRALSGTAAGTLIASTAGPAYRAIHDHFTLSGNDLATALGDSFSRGLTAIDDELNGWRISRALGSRLRRDYQARIRADFLDPYASEYGLDEANRKALCRSLNQHSARLIQARAQLFPPAELPEPDIAELLAADVDGISELLLGRIEQTVEALPDDLRGFLVYRDLLGDAVLYFFRETLRRDPRVETTLNALQQAGLRRDNRQLDQRLAELQRQQQDTQQQMLAAVQAADVTRMNQLMPALNQLDETVTAVRQHTQRLNTFQDALDGEHWLQQHGPLSLEQGFDVACQVARVLQLAHEQGICHHDLKPANLLLQATDDGIKVTVIDFGLSSKVIELHQRLGRGSISGHSVMAQQVFGSLDYAPPEQRGMGHAPGPWSDLYSLAITLYRLLTGVPPNPPNPFLLPDDKDLQQLLFQCLHHEPEQRPTAAQFLERVSGLASAGEIPRAADRPSPPFSKGGTKEPTPPLQKGAGSAASGGFPFHFGETINTEQANYNGNATYGNGIKGEFRQQTTPVGRFPANAWGLHDMHGNVWEWTGSEYDAGYTGPEQWLLGADAADDVRRVVRGGSWLLNPHWVRSANRDLQRRRHGAAGRRQAPAGRLAGRDR